MGSSLLLIAIFLLGNLLCIIMIWSTHLSDEVNPKFISSSYDPSATIDFDSMILKSVNKLISKYFKEPSVISKYVGGLPIGNNTADDSPFNATGISLLPDPQAKYILMLNQDKTELRILQIARNIASDNPYDNYYNDIALYSIPIDNFLISYKNDFELSKAIIRHCWSSAFPGKIIGAVTSNDKRTLLLAYRIVKGNSVTFRLRYIEELSCDSSKKELFMHQESTIMDEVREYLQSNRNKHNSVFESEDNSIEDQFTRNFLDDEAAYDDFVVEGNTPLSALAVKHNTIAYARDMDYSSFTVLQRNCTRNKWEEAFHTITTNRTTNHYYHTNSLKFITNDRVNDLKILQVYLTIDLSSIHLICEVIKANYTANSYLSMQLIRNKLDEDVIAHSSKYNLPFSLKRLQKYLRPTVYSNSNNANSMMEFFEGTLFFLDWNETGREAGYGISSSDQKIERIAGDEANENVIVMKAEKGELSYFNTKSNSSEYENTSEEKRVVFKSLPKKFREQLPLGFIIERFDKRVIMMMLMENGVVLSLDFTKIVEKENTQFWSKFLNEYNYTVLLILVANFVFFILFLKIFRGGRGSMPNNQRRAQEINQLIIDLNNINNELQTVRNAIQVPNAINEQPQPIANDNNNQQQGEGQAQHLVNAPIEPPVQEHINEPVVNNNANQPVQGDENNEGGPLIEDIT